MTPEMPEPVEVTVARAQLGDRDAFGELVERFTPMVMSFLRAQLNSREDCEDLTQQTFLEAFRHLRRLRERVTFPHWLLKLATHNLIDWRRRQAAQRRGGRQEVLPLDKHGLDVAAPERAPDAAAGGNEVRDLLMREMESLDEQKRVVVRMRLVAEMSISDIAASLEITEEAVRMRLSRGLRILRERLEHSGLLG